jgi:5'-nucleotidase
MLALHGMFERSFDLVVSGINPGANCGSSVYYSGTVGAIVVARNLGVSGLAVSQMTSFQDVHGQSDHQTTTNVQEWGAAAAIARVAASTVLSEFPTEPVAVNINVPNRSLAAMNGVRRAPIARHFGRNGVRSILTSSADDPNTYSADFAWGTPFADPDETDDGVVKRGYVAFSILSHLDDHQQEAAGFLLPHLANLLAPTSGATS